MARTLIVFNENHRVVGFLTGIFKICDRFAKKLTTSKEIFKACKQKGRGADKNRIFWGVQSL